MNKLYYGSGSCTLQSSSAVGLEIKYRGAIKITDKTPEGYNIISNSKKILIFPTGIVEPLTNLFEYTGDFKVRSVLASDINGERVYLTIKKVMDYPELMESNPEDMTEITVENMNAGYQHKGRVAQTTTDNKIIKNQRSEGELYLIDRSAYSGPYHVHIDTGKAMTGGEHNRGSQNLYTIRAKDGILVPTGGDRDPTEPVVYYDTPWGRLYTSFQTAFCVFANVQPNYGTHAHIITPYISEGGSDAVIVENFMLHDWIGAFTEHNVLCGAITYDMAFPDYQTGEYPWLYSPIAMQIYGEQWSAGAGGSEGSYNGTEGYPTTGDTVYLKVFKSRGYTGSSPYPPTLDNQTYNAYPLMGEHPDWEITDVIWSNQTVYEFARLNAYTDEPYTDWYNPGGVTEWCKKNPRDPRCIGASTPQIR